MHRSLGRDKPIRIYLDTARSNRAADVLKAVGHPVRLRLIALLCDGDRNVTELASLLDLKQSIVSQQLAILRRERLVAAERAGGMSVYHLTEPHLRDMVRCLESCTLL